MEDYCIIDLYFNRDETAIKETDKKYGKQLQALSTAITGTMFDSEECVNDTYMVTWEHIPPTRPTYLFAYLAKIARNLSLHVYEKQKAQKRSATVLDLSEELNDCTASNETVESSYDAELLGSKIDSFLNKQPYDVKYVFMRRYFWADSISNISKNTEMTESKITSMLFRARNKLKKYLESEGFSV